jgi:uncharacterized protein (DUF1810 family)
LKNFIEKVEGAYVRLKDIVFFLEKNIYHQQKIIRLAFDGAAAGKKRTHFVISVIFPSIGQGNKKNQNIF